MPPEFQWTLKSRNIPRHPSHHLDMMRAVPLLIVACRLRRALWVSLLLIVPLSSPTFAQPSASALRVFMDCHTRCDMTFFRREIPYVNYVRVREDAQVHVLVTSENAGGGVEYTLAFHGLSDVAGVESNLKLTSSNTETQDERRRALARTFEFGLAPFVLRTPLASGLHLEYEEPATSANGDAGSVAAVDDPWDHWVFSTEVKVEVDSEKRQDELETDLRLFASRTTPALRLRGYHTLDRRVRTFEFDDGSTLEDLSRRNATGFYAVKSIGEHWGVGAGAHREESTFRNLDRGQRIGLAVEYNRYPYSESSVRELRYGYFVGHTWYAFEEPTILGRTEERKANHGLYVEYDLDRRWGDISVNLRSTQFLDDLDLYRVSLDGRIDYRILRGLTLGLWAEASYVADQFYLPAGGVSDEDVLLGRRALDTDLKTSAGVRLRYTFGSIFNNVVNNRLRSNFIRIF
jgi:hypothetical protein